MRTALQPAGMERDGDTFDFAFMVPRLMVLSEVVKPALEGRLHSFSIRRNNTLLTLVGRQRSGRFLIPLCPQFLIGPGILNVRVTPHWKTPPADGWNVVLYGDTAEREVPAP